MTDREEENGIIEQAVIINFIVNNKQNNCKAMVKYKTTKMKLFLDKKPATYKQS